MDGSHEFSSADNGLNWATAFTSIQDAVDAAANGDMIWVRANQYDLADQFNLD